MAATGLLTTSEVAARLGVARQTVVQRVQRGALVPATKLNGPRGAYLFDAEQVDALAADAAPSNTEGAAS